MIDPEIQAYIDEKIRMHIHDGNFAQRVNFPDIFGNVETLSAAPTEIPAGGSPFDSLKIYNGFWYYYDFLNSVWKNIGVASPDNAIQFNDGGVMTGDAALTWDTSNENLVVGSTAAGSLVDLKVETVKFNYAAGKVSFLLGAGEFKVTQATLNTTSAALTTLATYPIGASSVTYLESRIAAIRTGGSGGSAGDGAGYVRRGTYNSSALIGSVQDAYTAESQAGWDVAYNISGSDVLLQVTGAANNNITWKVTTFTYFF